MLHICFICNSQWLHSFQYSGSLEQKYVLVRSVAQKRVMHFIQKKKTENRTNDMYLSTE